MVRFFLHSYLSCVCVLMIVCVWCVVCVYVWSVYVCSWLWCVYVYLWLYMCGVCVVCVYGVFVVCLCVLMIICVVWCVYTRMPQCMEVKGQLFRGWSSLSTVIFRGQTQVIRLGSKSSYLLNHLAGPHSVIWYVRIQWVMRKLGVHTSGLRPLFNSVSNFLGEVGLFGLMISEHRGESLRCVCAVSVWQRLFCNSCSRHCGAGSKSRGKITFKSPIPCDFHLPARICFLKAPQMSKQCQKLGTRPLKPDWVGAMEGGWRENALTVSPEEESHAWQVGSPEGLPCDHLWPCPELLCAIPAVIIKPYRYASFSSPLSENSTGLLGHRWSWIHPAS